MEVGVVKQMKSKELRQLLRGSHWVWLRVDCSGSSAPTRLRENFRPEGFAGPVRRRSGHGSGYDAGQAIGLALFAKAYALAKRV